MSTLQPSVGIDVAKRTLQVALLVDGKLKQKSCPNTSDGFVALLSWLDKHAGSSVHVALEATGRFHEAVACTLAAAGHTVSVLNPLVVQRYAQCRLTRTKTDPTDAALLAEFCHKERPAAWQAPAPELRELQELVRHVQALEERRQAVSNQLGSGVLSAFVTTSLEELIGTLTGQIEAGWRHIQMFIDQHPQLKRQRKLLVSIPGIAQKTAAVLLAEIQDVSRFEDVRQLVAFAGLCPKEKLSGSSVRGKPQLSKVGNARLRKALFMPALVAKRWNPLLRAHADRLAHRGKTQMAILGALMRKLLHLAYGVLKNGMPVDPHFAACQAR